MTPELMPCPFCGKQPFVDDCGRIGGGWSIRCICMHAPGVMDHRRAVAEDFWNIRASLVDSNEIRDIASELEDATAAMNWKVVRGLVTRLKAASRSSSPSSTTATPDTLHPADEAMLQSYATRQIGEGMPGMVQDASKLARYAIILRMQLSRALPSSRALSEETANLVASLIREWQWERPQREPVEVAREIIDPLTGAPK